MCPLIEGVARSPDDGPTARIRLHSIGTGCPMSAPIYCTLRGSSQRLVECLGWCHPAEGLSRSTVELGGNVVEVGLGVQGEVAALGEVLTQQSVGVLVGAALPWAFRVTEVDRHTGVHTESRVLSH